MHPNAPHHHLAPAAIAAARPRCRGGLRRHHGPPRLAAGPASATDEFPAKPTVDATIECLDGGAFLQIDLGNESGLSSAHFDVTQDATSAGGYDVADFETTHISWTAPPRTSTPPCRSAARTGSPTRRPSPPTASDSWLAWS